MHYTEAFHHSTGESPVHIYIYIHAYITGLSGFIRSMIRVVIKDIREVIRKVSRVIRVIRVIRP